MSRAFVKEQEDTPEYLSERPISPNPNLVTKRGLSLIDAEIERLRQDLARAQSETDRGMIARASRDLRYWMQRRTSANLIAAPKVADTVGFASQVTTERRGQRKTFQIVGEDEADPTSGRIAYTSPLARALLASKVGDVIMFGDDDVQIVAIAPIADE